MPKLRTYCRLVVSRGRIVAWTCTLLNTGSGLLSAQSEGEVKLLFVCAELLSHGPLSVHYYHQRSE